MLGSHQLIATCFAIIALGSTASAANPEARHRHDFFAVTPRDGDAVEITDLQPFTHVAYIPLGADLSSIKIEGIKVVKVATKRRSVGNASYCEQLWTGTAGSMYCQRTTDESPVPAYRLTYSYRGQPMASDEYGNTYFTFSVYFRLDEFGQELRRALSSGKIRRTAVAEFFELATFRDSTPEVVIDGENSTLCSGNYVDGNWIHTNPKCEDRVVYKRVANASSYIGVKVDPATARLETAGAERGPRRK